MSVLHRLDAWAWPLRWSRLPAAVAVAFSVLLAGSGIQQVLNVRSAFEGRARSDEVVARAAEAERLLVDQQASVRGFVTTLDPAFLRRRDHAALTLAAHRAELDALVAGDPEQRARLAAVWAEMERWRANADRAATLRAFGQDAGTFIAATLARFEHARALFASLHDAERARGEALAQVADVQTTRAIVLVGALLVCGTLGLWALSHALAEVRRRQELADAHAGYLREVLAHRDWLGAVLAQLPAAVAVADAKDGCVVYRNAALRHVDGGFMPACTAEHARLGWERHGEKLRPEDYPLVRALAGESVTDEVHAPRADGTRGTFEVVAGPLRHPDGKIDASLQVLVDVTQHELLEKALEASEQRERAARTAAEQSAAFLDALFSASPVGFAFFDRELRYARVNEALAENKGITTGEHIGRTPRELMPDPLGARVEELLRRVLETERAVETDLTGAIRGESRHWIVTYYPVRMGDGPLVGVGAVVQNVTALKTSEQARGQLLDRERAAHREAQRAMRARDDFLAVVSHDLRNPLGVIALGAGVLLRKYARAPDVAIPADRIRQAARRMDRMIEDLLDVGRAESGRLRVTTEPTSVPELVHEVVSSQAPLIEDATLRFRSEVASDLPPVLCDRGRVVQVLANLLGNATKYTPAGGTVSLHVARDPGGVRFSVADTGVGMSEEQQAHAFERFWQAQKGAKGGLGLGLYVARAIIEAHRGRIWVQSRAGVGTTFHFTLPAAAVAA